MAVDAGGECGRQPRVGIAPFILRVSTSKAMTFQFSAPAPWPAKKSCGGSGRVVRSTALLTIWTRSLCEKAAKAVAVFDDVGEGSAQWRFGRGEGTMMGPPIVRSSEDRDKAFLLDGRSANGLAAADVGLDGVESSRKRATPFSPIGVGPVRVISISLRHRGHR